MSQLVTLDDRAAKLQQVFTQNMAAMVKMAPRTMGDPTRLIRIAYNTIAYNSDLAECSATKQGMASILGGVMEALKLGLTIGGPAQEAWLIPFKNKGVMEATLIIGYQGFRNIIDRSKSVIDVHPRAVYQNDEFDVDFGANRVRHKPWYVVGAEKSGELILVYAIAHLQRGGVQIEVMPRSEIDEHRKRSRAANSGPWVTDYDAMALKTVIRKIAKYLPKSSEILQRALELDTQADIGMGQNYDVEGLVFDVVAPAVKQVGGTKLDQLKGVLQAGKQAEAPQTVHVPVKATPEEAAAMTERSQADMEEVRKIVSEEERREEERRQQELDEIERKIRREQDKERERTSQRGAPATNGARHAPSHPPATDGPTQVAEGLFEGSEIDGQFIPATPDQNAPIGPSKAQELLERIRKNGPKRG
jgi:recombination protein RecT